MQILSYEEACHRDFHVDRIFAMRQWWSAGGVYSYENVPRSEHGLLLCLRGGSAYTHAGAELHTCHAGDVLYLPEGVCYLARMEAGTEHLLINFNLCDNRGRAFALSDTVLCLAQDAAQSLRPRFEAVLEQGGKSDLYIPPIKAELMLLLHTLFFRTARHKDIPEKYREIEACILYVENHLTQRFSVPSLAARCALSETTFRTLFREYTGVSPLRYINRLKVQQACRMLRSREVTAEYICEQLNFYDLSHFHRLFHRFTGLSPSEYRAQVRAQRSHGAEKA